MSKTGLTFMSWLETGFVIFLFLGSKSGGSKKVLAIKILYYTVYINEYVLNDTHNFT